MSAPPCSALGAELENQVAPRLDGKGGPGPGPGASWP